MITNGELSYVYCYGEKYNIQHIVTGKISLKIHI